MENNYYFIGIKGAGMSALALILSDLNYNVIGSDVDKYFFTEKQLRKRSIKIQSFNEEADLDGVDCVIVGNAFTDEHKHIVQARNKGLKIISYPEFLGSFASRYKNIAITGTHGKTTTTGMIAAVLAGVTKSGYLIGDGSGYIDNNAEYFAYEACEYRNHFLSYSPDYAIITNIEFDHPDFFKDLEDVINSFKMLSQNVKKGVIICNDDENLRNATFSTKKYTYGTRVKSDVFASNIQMLNTGIQFDLELFEEMHTKVHIPFYGIHMLQNSLAIITALTLEGFKFKEIIAGLKTFNGVERRFNEQTVGSNIIIDDYAHHPTEIRVTLDAIRQKYGSKNITIIFQPHTFSRTEALFNEFAIELSKADKVYLLDIFGSARENNGNITILDLQNVVQGSKIINESLAGVETIENGVIVFMGAGTVNDLIPVYKKLIEG